MEVHQIRYFLALCETLNFTRAAETCHVSQPSLTRAIHGLEEELAGQLFHRERNNTHLTDLGRIMKPYLEQVSANMNAARDRAEHIVKLGAGDDWYESGTPKLPAMASIAASY